MDVSRDVLLSCLAVPRWADEVRAGRPYTNAAGVLAAAFAASRELTDEELTQALSGHPRIGERGDAQSRLEQSGVHLAIDDNEARLVAGNAAYEDRFGRVFIIRAAGRDGDQILAELDRRLRNDDETERAETVENLRQIALMRLEAALT